MRAAQNSAAGHSLRYDLSATPLASQVFATGARQRKTNRALMSETSADKPEPEAIPLNIYVRHEFFSFFLPHFPGAPRSERPLLPRRAGALREGPVPFRRNRESRTHEAAGRRNWPEAVPRKNERQKKAGLRN